MPVSFDSGSCSASPRMSVSFDTASGCWGPSSVPWWPSSGSWALMQFLPGDGLCIGTSRGLCGLGLLGG